MWIAIYNLRSSSQSSWPLRNIHISNDDGSFTFYVDVFFLLSIRRFTGLDCIYGCFIRSSNWLSFASIWVHPCFFGGVHVAHRFMFLNILSSVLWCPLQFQHKKMFGSSLPPVVYRLAHVFFTLFVFVCT